MNGADPHDPPVADDHEVLVRRLRRVEGQIRGLQQMLSDQRPCRDVVTQLTAARKALQQTGFLLVAERMHECASGEGSDSATMDEVEQMFLELK